MAKYTVRNGNAYHRFKVSEKRIVERLDGPKRRSIQTDFSNEANPILRHVDVNARGRVWTF